MASFVVHGGYKKTGTSFLQEHIFSHLNDVFYIGKRTGKMFSHEIQTKYQRLFPHSYSTVRQDLCVSNSSLLISSFGDILLKKIKETKKDIMILSNEDLFDYENHNSELNQFLLFKLFSYLQANYDEKIEFKVMMTIRNQKDLLKSYFAFNSNYYFRDRFHSFDNFLKSGIENNYDSVFGGYHYDEILKAMQDIYGLNNVRFFIYEKMNEDIRAFFHDILDFIGTNQSIEDLNYSEKVNVNSNEGVHRILEFKDNCVASFFMRLVKVCRHNRSILEFLKKVKLFQHLNNIKESYCHKHRKVVVSGYLYEFPPELITDIESIYKNSNIRLSQMLKIDLGKYGYIGG